MWHQPPRGRFLLLVLRQTPDARPAECVSCGVALSAVRHYTRAENKVAAGVCGILLGSFGVHRFILGYTGAGLTMLRVKK